MSYDPHRSTSVALTAVRTVHSRARKALAEIGHPGLTHYPSMFPHEGDDLDAIRTALQQVELLLRRWERYPTRRSVSDGRQVSGR